MILNYQVDVSGWENALAGGNRRLNNLTPVHREIGQLLVEMTRQNFDTSGGNEKWDPLEPSTLLQRARNPNGRDDISAAGGGPHRTHTKRGTLTKKAQRVMASAKPLLWSKRLYRSMTYDPQRDYVDVGTPMIKARTLFFGGKGWHGSRVPARWPYRFRVGDAARIAGMYARYVFQGRTS